jgi:DNA mismatch endonuclease (patch repair protein)
MADNHTTEVRKYNMSKIGSKNTKPEEVVRKYLFSQGFRYRKNVKYLQGCPDIVLPKYKTVIFVNGCFWHKHNGCKYFVWPKSNEEYWHAKIERNVSRDNKSITNLEASGWIVIVIWECETRKNRREEYKQHLVSLCEAKKQTNQEINATCSLNG